MTMLARRVRTGIVVCLSLLAAGAQAQSPASLPPGAVVVTDGGPGGTVGAPVTRIENLADPSRPLTFTEPVGSETGALVTLGAALGHVDLSGIDLRGGATLVAAVRPSPGDSSRWTMAASFVRGTAGSPDDTRGAFMLIEERANPWFGAGTDLGVRRGGTWAAFARVPVGRVRVLTLRLDPAGVSAAWIGRVRVFDVAATPASGLALAAALGEATHLRLSSVGYAAPAEGGLVRVWPRPLSDAEVGAAVAETEQRLAALGDPVTEPSLYLDLFGDSISDPTNTEPRVLLSHWPNHIDVPGVLGRGFARSASTLLASGVPGGPTVAAQVELARTSSLLPPRPGRTAERLAVLFAGTNEISQDLSTGLGAAEAVAALATLVAALRDAGYDRVVVATMLPRTTTMVRPGMTQADVNLWRDAYNAAIRAGASGADVVWDVGAAAALADPSDLSVYADGIHPTQAGAALVAAHFEAAFAEELARAEGAPPVPTPSEAAPGDAFQLSVHPNPVRGVAQVSVGSAGPVRVALYDAAGRHVRSLYDGTPGAGTLVNVPVDGRRLAPGVYVVRATGAGGTATRRVVVVR